MEQSLLSYIWILIIFLIFVHRFKQQPQVLGWIGERKISSFLRNLPSNHYIVLNDIMIRNKTSTTQIGHIVVSQFGIFVLETKNYSGWIFGDSHSKCGHKFYIKINIILLTLYIKTMDT